MRVYESTSGTTSEVRQTYEAALARHGWRLHEGTPERVPGGAIYELGNPDLLVQIRADALTGNVFVSTIETRGPRAEQ